MLQVQVAARMKKHVGPINTEVKAWIKLATSEELLEERVEALDNLVEYVVDKVAAQDEVHINFICTHNSRRSQLSQVWAQVASYYFQVPANCYSGGVEVTAFNDRAVASLERAGFSISQTGSENPRYKISFGEECPTIQAFSKLYDDADNPTKGFAAVMTCSHADENCPFILGADVRLPIRYDDPKEYDDTKLEATMYDVRSLQIASEMFYVFQQASARLSK